MFASIKRFLRNESGLETVEYAVMTALIIAALIAAIGLLVAAVSGRFGAVSETVNSIEE